MKKIILILIYFTCFDIAMSQETILQKKNLAKSYIEAELYEDAIVVYKNILNFQKKILGNENIELVNTLFTLSDLYLLEDKKDSSKIYLNKALKIQYFNFIINQKKYLGTYSKLKSIYVLENDSTKIHTLDSLISILETIENDSIYINADTSFIFPEIISNMPNEIDSTSLVSEYTKNDQAIELFNNALSYIDTGLYTEAATSLSSAIELEAGIIDLDYLINTNFGDSLQLKNLYDNFATISENDSTIFRQNLFLGILSKQLNESNLTTINYMKKYVAEYPNDKRGFLFLANLYLEFEDYISAMHYYHRLLLIDENHFDANFNIGAILVKMKDYKNAISILNKAHDLDNNHFESKNLLGFCYYNLGEYKKSIYELTQALLLNSKNSETYYYLGKSYKSIDKNKQALEALNMSIKLDPFNGYAHFELGKIYEQILKVNLAIDEYRLAYKYIDSHELNYKYGKILFKEQEFRKALLPLRKFIIFEPDNIEILEILGEIFMYEKRFTESIDTYGRLIEKFPDNEIYHSKIAESFYNLNNFVSAQKYYEKVLSFNEDNTEILFKLGSISNLLYDYKKSEKYLLEAIYCGFTSKDILFELGIAYGGQQKYLQALICLKEALNYSLDDPILHYQLGIIYNEMEIYDLAIIEFQQYIDKIQDDPISYRLLGDCYANLKQFEQSIINYRKALELYDYEDVKTIYSLGLSYFEISDNINAAKYFKSILKINYDYSKAHHMLVKTYINLGRFREAKKECDILFMLDTSLYNSLEYCKN